MAAAATTALPSFLISLLLLLFVSCSHITTSCFAIATATPEGQGQVPSSVTPKAAAVHYWHIKTRNTKPPPPIFLSKLSPISPFKLITTNDETMRAVSEGDKVKMQKIDVQNAIIYTDAASVDMKKIDDQNAIIYTHAPHDRHPTTSDDTEKIDDQNAIIYVHSEKIDDQNAIIYTHAPHDRHPSANEDMGKIDDQNAIIYTHAPQDRHLSPGDDMDKIDDQNAIIYAHAHAEKIDDQNAIIYTHAPHHRHPSTSDDKGKIDDQNAIIYTHAPHDRHASASEDMGKIDDQNAIIYAHAHVEKIDDQISSINTHVPHHRHPSASDDMGKIDDQNAIIYTRAPRHQHPSASHDAKITSKHRNFDSNINIKMVAGDELMKEADQNRPNSRGTFYFRESELKEGKMISSLKFVGRGSSQYFLPRSIASKIPFSASALGKIFHIPTDSAMHMAMKTTIGLCRMPPNTGETKQCVTSAEDMIDYALSTLGANTDIRVWSTHNLSGFGGKSLIGKAKVVHDGELTAKNHVTCHKETFPYLVYACHDVFKTRVYDLEILDAETKEKINQGAALCHLDTSAWSPGHASFAAVGSAPGKTEVCHWVAPWDMVWTAGHVAE